MRRLARYFFTASLLFPALGAASTIDLGVISFDNLIPDGVTPGVNAFISAISQARPGRFRPTFHFLRC